MKTEYAPKPRPPDHAPNCRAILYNGNFPCDCGDDERWEREYKEYIAFGKKEILTTTR